MTKTLLTRPSPWSLPLLLVCCTANLSNAQLNAGSQTVDVVFDQIITILDNPLGIPPGPIPIRTAGSFTATWADESLGVAQVTDFVASGSAVLPPLGNYTLDVPGVGPGATFSGDLSNITSDASGQLIIADLGMNLTYSVAFTDPAADGLTLYTKDTSFFLGPLSGGSNVGAVYADPQNGATDIYTTILDPMSGQPVELLIAQSSDRMVTAVPEPVCGGILFALLLFATRRR